MSIGLIIGTGVDENTLVPNAPSKTVSTRYGPAEVLTGEVAGGQVVMVRRHGHGHSIPPHRINYRANIAALQASGVRRVLSTSAVGSINVLMEPGHFCVPDDFIDLTRARPFTFYDGEDGKVVHTDLTRPYCDGLRGVLLKSARSHGLTVHGKGCYACMEGPRYETPAEVKALGQLGADIVGMTNATEAILCREAGLCFSTLALVTNWAAGISPERLDHKQVTEEVQQNKEMLVSTILASLKLLHQEEISCDCVESGE